MKKAILLSLFILFTALYGFSQMSLSLSDSTGPIANGATVTLLGNSTTDEIIAYAFVTNTGTTALPVKVKKVELHLTSGAVNMFCWGLCFSPTVYVSPTPITINPGQTDSLDFSGHCLPGGNAGYTLIRYVFFDDSNPSDSVCFIINYSHFALGLNETAATGLISPAYPNPASSGTNVDIDIPAGSQGKLVLRNVTGAMVKEMDLRNGESKVRINTSDLADGVYFYSLVLDGKPQVTKKLIIRH